MRAILSKSKIVLWRSRFALLYVFILLCELKVIGYLSDLPSGATNWSDKAGEIINFQFPTDNFYGPGAAILMVPFSIIPNTAYLANFFYLAVGSFGYWRITSLINSFKARIVSRCALPVNFYLLWLINSSQDTVFEFALLVWGCYFLVIKRWGWFVMFTYLLCLTRAGYWVFFLGISLLLFSKEYLTQKRFAFRKLYVVPILVLTSMVNFALYSSPSPALEGGLTAYFSYTKYHYLSLPKMDMDVFLSGPDGAFSENFGPKIPKDSTPAETNSIYQRAAIESALANKKETVLGWMQKFDSYFFDVQKVPHLPGSYQLSQSEMKISILDERLSWKLVLGNLIFMIYRTALVVAAFLAIGLYLGAKLFRIEFLQKSSKLTLLAYPYVFGLVPGILFYTETRFKIVSELLLVPLVAQIWALSIQARRVRKDSLL